VLKNRGNGLISILTATALLVACSGGNGRVVTPSGTRNAEYVMNECAGCNTYGGTPAPAPTPDVGGEVFCNNAGGDFLDITGAGGTGLSCAGGNGDPGSIVGSKCGIKYWMSGGGKSTVTLPDGTTFDSMVKGLQIDGDDCSYQLTY
jgi:hypothetical protein